MERRLLEEITALRVELERRPAAGGAAAAPAQKQVTISHDAAIATLQAEGERQRAATAAQVRADIELMLDALLRDVRGIADRLDR
jgi:hypothetical protein